MVTPTPSLRLVPGLRNLAAVARLALPIVIVQVGLMAMGVVDTVMVGHVSPADLAAVALGNLYFFVVIIFGMGVVMALDPVVSQGVGAGDASAVARAVQRGLILAGGLAVLASLLLVPGDPLFSLLGQPEEVVPVAARYAWASIPGTFPFLVFVVFRQTLQAMERVAPIVVAIVVANLSNLLLNWVFIFGHAGVPAMGAVGSGWASSAARWIMVLFLGFVSWRALAPYVHPFRSDALAWRPLARMLRLGLPVGVQLQLEIGVFGVIALMMGWMGTIAMAGHQVAINLASFTFMVPLGVSQAAAVLVGHAVGRGDPEGARRTAGAGLVLGGGFMCLTAVAFLTAPGLLGRLYTDDGGVLGVALILIPMAGIFQVFDGLQVVASGVLRGVGDTRSPMLVNLLGFWLVGFPVSVHLGFRTSLGPVGLWWGLVVGLGVVAVLLLVRVEHRMGRDLRRILIDEEEQASP